jgi:O-6-methylguanine DNA methyltransferase
MNKAIPAATQTFETNWGWAGLAATDQGLCVVILPRRSKQDTMRALAHELRRGGFTERESEAKVRQPDMECWVNQGVEQLSRYLDGTVQAIDLSPDLRAGTPFQRKVWRLASSIPYGRVRSYGWIAARLGGRQYARAVGLALGANPVPIVVPCHRIVSHDGSLGGFSGGLQIKRKLLALEGSLAQLR